MLKKILLMLAVVFSMAASAQTLKVGLVDTNALLSSMPEVTEAQKKLQETQSKYETQYNSLQAELQKQYEELNNMKEDVPELIRKNKTQAFVDNQQKLQQFEQQIVQEMQKQQAELMAPIYQKVQDAIQSVGKEGNFSLIQGIDPQLTFYYSAPVEDVTPLVKTKLGIK
ncbi:MAG: OmpH family outer membrane protein [Muribaculaceae bacterium]|nr:OmpH family outer membrane protein [Muribaculaceae bacterium]